MLIYLISLPIWNFVIPTYAFWKFDDFSWGDTRKTAGGKMNGGAELEGEFDSSKITMKRWAEFERENRAQSANVGSRTHCCSQRYGELGHAPHHNDEEYVFISGRGSS